MDIDGLRELLARHRDRPGPGEVRDTTEPSVLAHEILNGQPFTFLDDAPLEERRSRAVPLPRGLPVEARELGRLDPAAIERVGPQVRPEPRDPDELHDLLMTVLAHRPEADWQDMFGALVARRAGRSPCTARPGRCGARWNGGPPSRRCSPARRSSPTTRARCRAGDRSTRTRPRPTCSAATWSDRGPSTAAALGEATGLPRTWC